jgi:hypothetical protein
MKGHIQKKLEESHWLSALEIEKWVKESFSLDKHLSYDQIHEIVVSWRDKNSISSEEFVVKHVTNQNNLQFLRLHLVQYYRKGTIFKCAKINIWASDFQLNRLKHSKHAYIDGTFCTVPNGYKQLIVIFIRDPNTGFAKLAVFCTINSKDQDVYELLMTNLRTIVQEQFGEWKLDFATVDFEDALVNGVKKAFPDITIVGCLFHFKQALWRYAQANGFTTNENLVSTKDLIDKLSSLSFQKKSEDDNTDYDQLFKQMEQVRR